MIGHQNGHQQMPPPRRPTSRARRPGRRKAGCVAESPTRARPPAPRGTMRAVGLLASGQRIFGALVRATGAGLGAERASGDWTPLDLIPAPAYLRGAPPAAWRR